MNKKPILFREHRGSLADSMETVVEVDSLKDLENWLNKIKDIYNIENLKINWYTYDDRVDWDTYIVTGEFRYGINDTKQRMVLGFTNGELK